MSYLLQILLPQFDNDGQPFPQGVFEATRRELIDRFGGLTAYMRAPARGLWKAEDGSVARDDIIIFEVMADQLDRQWWRAYRATLEARFRQDEIMVRASSVDLL